MAIKNLTPKGWESLQFFYQREESKLNEGRGELYTRFQRPSQHNEQ